MSTRIIPPKKKKNIQHKTVIIRNVLHNKERL